MGARTVARASPPEGGTGVRKGWGEGEFRLSGGLVKCAANLNASSWILDEEKNELGRVYVRIYAP